MCKYKILIVPSIGVEIPPKYGGAIEIVTWELVKNIVLLWKNVKVVLLTISPYPPYFISLVNNRLNIIRVPVPKGHNTYLLQGLIKYVAYLIYLIGLMLWQRFHIINVHYNIFTLVITIIAKLKRTKVVLTLHIPHTKPHHIFLKSVIDRMINATILFFERLSAKFSDGIIVTSKFVGEQFESATSSNFSHKIFIIPLGIYMYRCQPEYKRVFLKKIHDIGYNSNIILKSKVISYLGRIIEYKNIHKILCAVKILYEKYNKRNFTLIIAGPLMKYGYKKSYDYAKLLEEFINLLKIHFNLNIIFLQKALSENEKRGLLCLTDVFILPSISEGFGLTALEAMAYGVPIVLSYIDALKELLPNDLAWLYLHSISPDEIALKIKQLIELDIKKYLEIKQKLQHRARDFSWHKVAECYIRYFLKLLN